MKFCTWLTGITVIAIFLPSYTRAQGEGSGEYESVEVNGITMAYRIYGQGEPVVLLHGLTQTGANWDPLIGAFSSQYRVLVPDLRGHGQSTNPSGEFTHRQVAADVYALLDHLDIWTFKGMGVSTGAMTLLHLATSQPERVEAMVLISGTPYFPEQARSIQRSSAPDSMLPSYLENLAQSHSGGMQQAREVIGYLHAFKDNYDDMNFTPPYLSSIRAHTLIVHGDRDQFFPASIPLGLYEAIPNSYLWILPNAGHLPLLMNDRGRNILAETVLELFAGEWN
jgi:pimeloyl-ACP methyl ester carboxylesterase